MDDEWFIVDLLLKLTRQHKGIVAAAVDSDGQFMLIEAANHLPAWANPETCAQNVSFIVNYYLVLINQSINQSKSHNFRYIFMMVKFI